MGAFDGWRSCCRDESWEEVKVRRARPKCAAGCDGGAPSHHHRHSYTCLVRCALAQKRGAVIAREHYEGVARMQAAEQLANTSIYPREAGSKQVGQPPLLAILLGK